MSTRRASEQRPRDAGAALILAIGFVVMIGAISAGLAGLVTSSLNNRGNLEMVRDRQYAADGAIEEAISQVRAAVAPASAACAAGGSIVDTSYDPPIRVDLFNACEIVRLPDGTVVAQRNVIFSACQDTGTPPCADLDVIIRAQVNFDQFAAVGSKSTYVQSWTVNR